jgi:hypothetical protein
VAFISANESRVSASIKGGIGDTMPIGPYETSGDVRSRVAMGGPETSGVLGTRRRPCLCRRLGVSFRS